MKENAIFRVRDWKGYGIVQQCGTCEPLQSRTLAGCNSPLRRNGHGLSPVPSGERSGAVVTHRR